jgi:hypothetical protein
MNSLKRTCSILALLVALGLPLRDAIGQEAATLPAAAGDKMLTLEGAPIFVRNDPNLRFNRADDKLGNLGDLGFKDMAGYGRVAFTNKVNQTWDLRVAASALTTDREEKSSPYVKGNGTSTASQAFRMAFADVEAGAHVSGASGVDLRLLGGIRTFRSEANGNWATDPDDKVGRFGRFDDKGWGIGPRVGAELTMPLSKGMNLVTGASLAALYRRDLDRFLHDTSTWTRTSASSWSINADAFGGISLDLDGGAKFAVGYRAQYWDNMLSMRTEVKKDGNFEQKGRAPFLAHGPFVSLTFPIGGR